MRASQRDDMKTEILDAIERLVKTKPYADISINDICSEAYISKPTFYRYFKNKDNVVRWMSKRALRCGMAQIGRSYSWFEGNYRTACMCYQRKALFCAAQSPALAANLADVSSSYLREALADTVVEHRKRKLTDKLALQIECLSVAQGHMARRWVENGMDLPPRVMAEYCTSIVPCDLFELLDAPLAPHAESTASDHAGKSL